MIGPRWLAAAAGGAAAAAAWPLQGTAAGALLWMIACGVACAGHGQALERACRVRVPAPLAVTAGLAGMLVAATVLGRLGILAGPARHGLVIAGVALAALPRGGPAADPASAPAASGARFRLVVGGLAALALVALAVVRLETPIADGVNHVLAVKRLWDTGALDAGPHASGLYVAGGALFAWGGGAESAAVFEAVCAALLLAIVAGELPREDRRATRIAFAFVAFAVVLPPPAPGEAAAALLHLAAFLSLRAPIAERRTGWLTIGFALALALLRHELAFLAVPYAAAAVALPRVERPSRRQVALALAGWLVVVLGIQLALGQPAGNALGKSAAMLAAAPLAALLLGLLGALPWRSAYGALCFAVAGYLIAVAVYAILPADHAGSMTAAMGLTIALVLLLAFAAGARTPSGPAVREATAALAVGALAMTSLLLPAFGTRSSAEVAARFSSAVIALRERAILGADRAHEAVRAAQLRAPEGARLAFWGQSAARLDFDRNPIRDVSFTRRIHRNPIAPGALDGADFLVLEDVRPARVPAKGPRRGRPEYVPALEHVADRVELVASEGRAHLYRVRR